MSQESIHGIVNKIIFKNEENHFAIFTIERDKDDEICVLTNHPNIFENISAQVADVGEVIDRRTTRIKADPFIVDWF